MSAQELVVADRNLEAALGLVRDVLAATGAAVEVQGTLVETAEQARELRFFSSPTIRIDGRSEIESFVAARPTGSASPSRA